MNVSTIRMRFDRGDESPAMRVIPRFGSAMVDAALRCMIAESQGRFAHRVEFKMADGSTVVARPR